MTTKRKRCPSCGRGFAKGTAVYLMLEKKLERKKVCKRCAAAASKRCAAAAIRILVEPPMQLVAKAVGRAKPRRSSSPLMQHVRGES
jgi:hypothetical protein